MKSCSYSYNSMRLLDQETVTVQIHSLWSQKCKVSQEQTGHICPPDTFNRPLRYNSLQRKWRRLYAEAHGQSDNVSVGEWAESSVLQ